MKTPSLNQKEAKELFLNQLICRAYDGAIESTISTLEEGPAGRKPQRSLVDLHHWFQGLDDQSRKYVSALIQEAVDSSVFGCLVLLDGLTGGYPVKGEISDFAVYLQIYENEEAREVNLPRFSVRVNSTKSGDDLHDMFHWILRERGDLPGE